MTLPGEIAEPEGTVKVWAPALIDLLRECAGTLADLSRDEPVAVKREQAARAQGRLQGAADILETMMRADARPE